MTYDDGRYLTIQNMHLGTGRATNTSVIGTRVEIDRQTFMKAVTVTDFNIQVIGGDTSTGTENSGRWNIAISKSLGGTGAVTPFGSAVIGTAADGSVVDGSVTTETNFVSGDDVVFSYEVGTSLPAGILRVEGNIAYKEHFTN